jgi:hypothetical protein
MRAPCSCIGLPSPVHFVQARTYCVAHRPYYCSRHDGDLKGGIYSFHLLSYNILDFLQARKLLGGILGNIMPDLEQA